MSGESEGFLSFDSDKFQKAFSLYKLPFIFGIVGIILLFSTLIMLVKSSFSTPGVEFSLESTGSASVNIFVDVEGCVVNPGVYKFGSEERVEDALRKAGGLTDKADSEWIVKNLNRAAKLADGGKIYIPSIGESGGTSQSNVNPPAGGQNANTLGVTTGLININTASQKDLESLPGIGPVTAVKIMDARPYSSIDELRSKNAVGASVFEKIKDKVSVY